jgi:molybdopterin synthase sulfur carrier subunit
VSWAHVLFFGKVAARFGRSREVAVLSGGCSLTQLKTLLCLDVDGGADALAEPGLRVAVDQELCAEDLWILPGQEVAFCSMFSGG